MNSTEPKLDHIRASDGVEIPVRIFDGVPRGEGTPVVMLHGLHSHSGWFVQSAAFMASLGGPVYSFDRRGSGLSRESRGHAGDSRDLIGEIDAVVACAMDRHRVERVHILGHCLGAVFATLFACRHGEKVASLILPTPGIFTHVGVPVLRKVQVAALGPLASKRCIPLALEPEKLADLDVHRQFIKADPLAVHEVTASLCFAIFRAGVSLKRSIRRLNVPVFAAFAGKDRLSDNSRTAAFLRQAPTTNLRLITYPEATHILEFSEEKDRFFCDLADWMQNGFKTRGESA